MVTETESDSRAGVCNRCLCRLIIQRILSKYRQQGDQFSSCFLTKWNIMTFMGSQELNYINLRYEIIKRSGLCASFFKQAIAS